MCQVAVHAASSSAQNEIVAVLRVASGQVRFINGIQCSALYKACSVYCRILVTSIVP